jgi:hypothetical protein
MDNSIIMPRLKSKHNEALLGGDKIVLQSPHALPPWPLMYIFGTQVLLNTYHTSCATYPQTYLPAL